MEHEGIAEEAIGSAKRWLVSAELNAGKGNYDSALYSLEMAVEISFKAVLLAMHMEVPKTHNVADVLAQAIGSDRAASAALAGKMDGMRDAFRSLLELRGISSYMYETRYDMKRLKGKYEAYLGPAEDAINACGSAVRQMAKHG